MTRRNMGVLLGLVGIVGLGSLWLTARTDRLSPRPLDNVPHGTTAAVWLDVPAVLRSALWTRLVEARGGDRGVRRIEQLCGADPLDQVSELTLFATGDEPEALERVGVIARGDFAHESLTDCVQRVVEHDGGQLERIEIDGAPGVAGRGSSRAAFVGRDGVVGGDESTVRSVLAAVRGDGRTLGEDDELGRLYDRVASGAHVVAVGRLPQRWRAAIQRFLRESVDAELASLSAVRALAIGARLTRGLGVGVVLAFDDAAAASAAESAIRRQIAEALDRPPIVLSAAGPALRRVDLETRDRELTLTLTLARGQVRDLLDLADQLLDARAAPPPPSPSRPPAPEPEPDEVLRPAR